MLSLSPTVVWEPVTSKVAVSCSPPSGVTKPETEPVAVRGLPLYSRSALAVVIVRVAGSTVSLPTFVETLLYWAALDTS